jgi:hypothetical protein
VNRYRQPFSSFYGVPSSAGGCQPAGCGTTCDSVQAAPGCNSCGSNAIQTAKQMQPTAPGAKMLQTAGRVVAPDFGTAPQNLPANRR